MNKLEALQKEGKDLAYYISRDLDGELAAAIWDIAPELKPKTDRITIELSVAALNNSIGSVINESNNNRPKPT